MWSRVRALIVKELLAVWRDRKGRAVLIVPPILQLVIFSFAATLEVKNVDIAVINRDVGRWGAELVRRIEGSPTFLHVVRLETADELRRAVDRPDVLVALRLGPEFSRDILAGAPARVQVILDGRNSNSAQIVQGYLARIVAELGAEVRPAGPAAGAIAVRHWYNPNLDYMWFTVPSLIAMIAMIVGLVVTALSVAREREMGTFDQLMVSPLRPYEILAGKTLPPLLIGFAHATLYTLVAVFLFGVPFTGSLLLLYGSLVCYLAAIIGVGLFISAIVRTQQQAILGAFLFAVPAVLLSGFASPIENMPGWLQAATEINPLRHFLVIVKGLFLKGLPARDVLSGMVPLILIAFVTLGVSSWLFRRRME